MPSTEERNIGAQFDLLDKALAARSHELLNRSFIYRQDLDSWWTSYNQLEGYANRFSNVGYVARQWRDEKPRYAWVPDALASKVRTANPANYDTTISISGSSKGCCGCGGGGTEVPQLPYAPVGSYGAGYTSDLPVRGGTSLFFGGNTSIPSLGDALRDLFGQKPQPTMTGDYPDSKLIDESGVFTGILTAIIVGAIFYVIHLVTKSK